MDKRIFCPRMQRLSEREDTYPTLPSKRAWNEMCRELAGDLEALRLLTACATLTGFKKEGIVRFSLSKKKQEGVDFPYVPSVTERIPAVLERTKTVAETSGISLMIEQRADLLVARWETCTKAKQRQKSSPSTLSSKCLEKIREDLAEPLRQVTETAPHLGTSFHYRDLLLRLEPAERPLLLAVLQDKPLAMEEVKQLCLLAENHIEHILEANKSYREKLPQDLAPDSLKRFRVLTSLETLVLFCLVRFGATLPAKYHRLLEEHDFDIPKIPHHFSRSDLELLEELTTEKNWDTEGLPTREEVKAGFYGLKAHNLLIEHNLRYVGRVVSKRVIQVQDFPVMLSNGTIGLMRAIEKFDPTRGIKFTTYATNWILQSLQVHRELADIPYRLPDNFRLELSRYWNFCDTFARSEGRLPTPEETMEKLGISQRKLQDLTSVVSAESLDRQIATSDQETNTTIGDLLPSDINTEEIVMEKIWGEEILALLDRCGLTERQKEVLLRHHGVMGEDAETENLSNIGKEWGVTRERARQIYASACRKVSLSPYAQRFRTLL